MATVITSNTETVENITKTLEAHGKLVVPDAAPATSEVQVDGEGGSSAQPAAPGGETHTAPGGENTAPASEAGDKTQGTQAPAGGEKEDAPSRGKFKAEKEKLRSQVERYREDLDLARGDTTKLRDRLAAAEAELAALKPAEKTKTEDLVRPARPKRADFQYDEDQYEAAMAEYDTSLAVYEDKLREKTIAQTKAEVLEEQRQRAEREAIEADNKAFARRVQDGAKDLEDYDELVDAMPKEALDAPPAVEGAIHDADQPALLIHYFMRDHIEDEGKELARFRAMSPVRQVREITLLETRLVAERGKTATPPADKPAATAAATAPEVPVKPRPAARERTEEPIETVGSRASAGTPTLGKAKNALEYAKLRGLGVNH